MNQYWGDWGVSSEVDTLKAVLLRRPGKEVEHFDAAEYRFADVPVDVELMRRQHDAVARIYKEHGVKVYYVEEQREDRPNAVFCRDLMFMTPEGAIITRPGMAARRGEERYIAKALADLGVPIVRTINGDGMFEGANAMGRPQNGSPFHRQPMQLQWLRTGGDRAAPHGRYRSHSHAAALQQHSHRRPDECGQQ